MPNSTDAVVEGLCKIGLACLKGEETFYPGSTFFIDPEAMTSSQLFFAFLVYGYVLFISADMIGDGAELLLLVPGYSEMVGSIVLPVLGAVPDGMMVLFSGAGPLAVAQENVAVGVGALAGSTIMLLTLPWILSVKAGLVDIDRNGKCTGYKKPAKNRLTGEGKSGVQFLDGVTKNGILMVITACTYFVIQFPAFRVDDQKSSAEAGKDFIPEVMREAAAEKPWALVGCFLSLFMFFGYLYLQYLAALAVDPPRCLGFLKHLLPPPPPPPCLDMVKEHGMLLIINDVRETFQKKGSLDIEAGGGKTVAVPYMDVRPKAETQQVLLGKDLPSDLQKTLKSLFNQYASKFPGKDLHAKDMREILVILGLCYTAPAFQREFEKADKDHGGTLDQQEFIDFFAQMISSPDPLPYDSAYSQTPKADQESDDGDEDDDEEEDEMPEDLRELTPTEQRAKLMSRSCKGMGIGTLLVLVFSDPMVDVLVQIGKVTGIPAFYVSFVLAPLASNAAELVSSFKLAQKKTQNTITQSLQTLEGAACMNNTFCLGIFLAVMYQQGLAWKFTAETISIFLVQVAVYFLVRSSTIQTMTTGVIIFSLYPLSLVCVYGLERAGLD